MRRRGTLTPMPSRNVCIFCCNRLGRDAASPLLLQAQVQRRHLNSTRNASLSAETARITHDPSPGPLGPATGASWGSGPMFARSVQPTGLNEAEQRDRQQMLDRQRELQRRIAAEKEAQRLYQEQRQRRYGRPIRATSSRLEGRGMEIHRVPVNSTNEPRFKVKFQDHHASGTTRQDFVVGQESVPSTWTHIQSRIMPELTTSTVQNALDKPLSRTPPQNRTRVGNFIRLVGVDPDKEPCPRCGLLGHFASECPSMGGRTGLQEHKFDTPMEQKPQSPIRVITRSGVSWQLDKAAHQVAREALNAGRENTAPAEAKPDIATQAEPEVKVSWQPKAPRPEIHAPKTTIAPQNTRKEAAEAIPNKTGRQSQRFDMYDVEVEDSSLKKGGKKARRTSRYEDEEEDYDGFKPRRRNQFDEDEEFEFGARSSSKAVKKAKKQQRKEQQRLDQAQRKQKQSDLIPIHLPEFISVSNLASALHLRVEEFIRTMEDLGFEDVGHDHILSSENAGLVAMEYGYEPITTNEAQDDQDVHPARRSTDVSLLQPRPPVVTIMGHVDHGKTTILDFLRKSSVAASEFGGITQHIGAFSVPLSSGKSITFLDTPGHAAFESMRKRGADVTDIVVLVVAADDSVKPQTIEAIKHAQAAGVPMIVAINKIDKEEANPDKVNGDLARYGVTVEDYGGDTQVVKVSGKTGQGMADLEEAIVTLSEILDHRAESDGAVEGWVLEATTKKAGRVTTVLVKQGTLRAGDILVAGTTWTRVRSLRNEAGQVIESAGPGMPVEVDGWKDQAEAGDMVLQALNEQKASDAVSYRLEKAASVKLAVDMEAINEARRIEQEKRAAEAAAADPSNGIPPIQEAVSEETATGSGKQTIPFIIKADVSGSAEAVTNALYSLGNDMISTRILRSGVGNVSEFDIEHAAAASGHIAAFNINLEPRLRQMAEFMGVTIIEDNVIYRLSEKVSGMLETKLPPVVVQRVVGEADVAMRFSIGLGGRKKVDIAGCKVRNGTISRTAKVRVVRDGNTIYDGTLNSLKNVKKDVSEMRKGTECGVGFDDWQEFEVGDLVQCYEEKSEKRTL